MRFSKKAVVLFFALAICSSQSGRAQTGARVLSSPWVPDSVGDTYRNPVIFADYSDPDVCRRGDDFYLVSSSFNQVPGLPILESKDLVNWKIIGHALLRLPPYDHYDSVRPGDGVWAPAIRFHDHKFYVYYPDPDFGIYLVTAKNAAGPWSDPLLVQAGKGLEDPCPFWDDNGEAYLIHAYAGSRAGIKSVLVLNRMSTDGTKLLDDGVIVYDGHGIDPTIEGPKLYKRKGYYYIFAPAGGVTNGWQIVLRSKHIYGPYERRVVLHQGRTNINGPHQGAWIETAGGQSWFIHFQDRGAYGRVDLLEPMKWKNGWPLIGSVVNSDSVGEPVFHFTKPDVGKEVSRSRYLRLRMSSTGPRSECSGNGRQIPALRGRFLPAISVTCVSTRRNFRTVSGTTGPFPTYCRRNFRRRNSLPRRSCASRRNQTDTGLD